jgi:hypothetical protein
MTSVVQTFLLPWELRRRPPTGASRVSAMEHAQLDFRDNVAELATLAMWADVVLPATPAWVTYRLSGGWHSGRAGASRFSFVRPSLTPAALAVGQPCQPMKRRTAAVTRSASLRG